MGARDPNYKSPPRGWLRASGPIAIVCESANTAFASSHYPTCTVNGGGSSDRNHPLFWFSATQTTKLIQGIRSVYPGICARIGVNSNGNFSDGTGGDQNGTFIGVSCPIAQTGKTGPGVWIGTNSFWWYFEDCTFGGNSSVDPTDDAAAAFLVQPGSGSGSGLIHINNSGANAAWNRILSGVNGGGIFVNNFWTENNVYAGVWITATSHDVLVRTPSHRGSRLRAGQWMLRR